MGGSQAVPKDTPGPGPREMGLLFEFWILSKTLLSRVVLATGCSVGPLYSRPPRAFLHHLNETSQGQGPVPSHLFSFTALPAPVLSHTDR